MSVIGRIAIAIGFLACAAAQPLRADPNILRADVGGDLGSLDPDWTTADLTRLGSFMIYDTLYGLDEAAQPQPQMVETHTESADHLVHTFTLRDGLTFHDGAPVTAADVIASWKRWTQKDARGQMVAKFTASLEALDPRTFRVTLNRPFGQLIAAISSPFPMPLFIRPARLVSGSADVEVKEAIGSGPYRFDREDSVAGAKAVFLRFDGYKPRSEPSSGTAGAKMARIPRIEWVVFSDSQTSISALQNNEIDVVLSPPPDLTRTLRGVPGIRVFPQDLYGTQGIMRLNHLNPPFDNPAIRRAIQFLVNQPDVILAVTGDASKGKVCGALMVCGSPQGSEIGAENLIDPAPQADRNARGMAALKAAGYKGEKIVILYAPEAPLIGPSTLVIGETMRKAGVNVDLQTMDWATVRQRRTVREPGDKGWHIFFTLGGGLSSADPAFNIPMSAACADAWFGWPCDKRIEELRERYLTETDPAKVKQIVEDIQRIGMEITLFIPYGQMLQDTAIRTSVQGMPKVPETMVFWNISKSE